MTEMHAAAAIHEGGDSLDIERLAEGAMRFLAALGVLLAIALVWVVRIEPTPAAVVSGSATAPELDREWLRQRPVESFDGMYRGAH